MFPWLKVLEGALTLLIAVACGNNCLYVAIGLQVKIEAQAFSWQKFKSALLEAYFLYIRKKGLGWSICNQTGFLHLYFLLYECDHLLLTQCLGDPEFDSVKFCKVNISA